MYLSMQGVGDVCIPAYNCAGGVSAWECVWSGVCLTRGLSGQEGVCQRGVSTTPQRWPLKRAVHILLEYIRVLANSCKSKSQMVHQ